jgi:hypothetical protein
MRKKFLSVMLALLSVSALGSAKDKTYRARVTYYSDGKQVAWSKVKKGIVGVSVAAHPDFKFGTAITIPALAGVVGDGKYVVHDRGPAVTKKTASKGKAYVFDVYVPTSARVRQLAYSKSIPTYMDVIVHR